MFLVLSSDYLLVSYGLDHLSNSVSAARQIHSEEHKFATMPLTIIVYGGSSIVISGV